MTSDSYERATAYLAKVYGVPLFEHHGRRHPVIVHRPQPYQIDNVDSIMGGLRTNDPRDLAIYDYGHLHTLQNSGRNLYNGDTYALHYLETQPLRIHGQPGKYFDMLATCDSLDREMMHTLHTRLIRLPLRNQLHRTLPVAQAVWRGAGRSAAIGGACLTVFNRGGHYEAIVARRGANNVADVDRLHVMPAFIFQPVHGDWQGEWQFSTHVYREYLEELYGVEESTTEVTHPAKAQLDTLLASQQASLHLTGVAYNLLTLRAEICVMLLIHDETWWQQSSDATSPLAFNAHSEARDGQLITVPIASDDTILEMLPQPLYTSMPPQAYAAFWLGIEMARIKLGIQSKATE